jgi:hypothetical protein
MRCGLTFLWLIQGQTVFPLLIFDLLAQLAVIQDYWSLPQLLPPGVAHEPAAAQG